jgi:hypothetical protein
MRNKLFWRETMGVPGNYRNWELRENLRRRNAGLTSLADKRYADFGLALGGGFHPEDDIQQISNPGGVLAPAIIGAGAYYAGKNDLIGKGIDTVKNVDYATIPDRILGGLEKKAADLTVGAIEGGQYLKDKYNAAEDYLDEGLARVGDFFDRSPPVMTGGPISRNSRANAPRRQYDGRTNEYFMTIPGTNVRRVWSAEPTAEVAQAALHEPQAVFDEPYYADDYYDNTPSHLIPGFDRMVNEGYDSWSPSDSTRSLGEALPYMTGVLAQEENKHNREANKSFSRGLEQGIQDTRSDWQKWKDSLKQGWEAK